VSGWLRRVRARLAGNAPLDLQAPSAIPDDPAQLRDTLEAVQTYFRSIVELSEDAIISVDRDQRITLFNESAGKIFGYRREDVLGRALDLLLPARYRAAHREHIGSFARSADALRPMNERGLIFGLRADGTEFPAEASISRFDLRGETVMTVRLRDVTERRRAEEGLSRLAAIVASSEDAIVGRTLDGTIQTWNTGAERLYGFTASEALGRSIRMLVPPDRLGELERINEALRRGEPVPQFETVRLKKNGTPVEVSLSLSLIRDPGGVTLGVSAIARDVTERKRLESQIRRAQKMEAIGTLAGGIAHDFNNLLSAMIGYAEMAGDELPAGSRAAESLEEVLAAGKRAKELVRQILTFSRQAEQERKPIQLHLVIKEALKLVRASLPATIEIRQAIRETAGVVLADPIQMHQVIMNLCANAEHAMRPAGGVLEVRLEATDVDAAYAACHPPLRPGPHVRLTVRDTGHGMDAKVVERIFDPFFTTKEPGEGTGMGLAMVHGIVTDHAGAVSVESAPGRGTRFQICLPRCPDAEAREAPQEQPGRGARERILVVDDEPSLAYLWGEMLERSGYRSVGFTSSLEALEAFQRSPGSFDLALIDQTMPQLTGDRLAREMLRLRPHFPIILCSGVGQTPLQDAAEALGVRAFLPKPLARRDLVLAVQRILHEHGVTRSS
jgi:PAS domain S-box-containing protein